MILLSMIDDEDDLLKFKIIHEKYKNMMYHVAYNVTKNFQDAEDVVQLSFVKLIDILYKIDNNDIDQARCKNLIITITKNTALDHLRKTERTPIPYDSIERAENSKCPEELFIEVEDYNNLIECINELSPNYKDILRLRYLQHLNSKEIAEILNISEFNVNTRTMRAKAALAEKLRRRTNK